METTNYLYPVVDVKTITLMEKHNSPSILFINNATETFLSFEDACDLCSALNRNNISKYDVLMLITDSLFYKNFFNNKRLT